MALQKTKIDIPVGGGLREDVDERLFQAPFARKVENVEMTKKGAYRKRRGMESLPGGATLPSDPTGVNAPFEYNNGIHLLSRRGVFAYNESTSTWHRGALSDTAPTEVERVAEIHGENELSKFDHATSGTKRLEVWQETLPSGVSRIWWQLSDIKTDVITKPAEPIAGTTMTALPRAFFADGFFWIWAFSSNPGTGTSAIWQTRVDGATGAIIAPNEIASAANAFDVIVDSQNPAQAHAVIAHLTTNFVYRWELGAIPVGKQLTDPTLLGAVALYDDPTGLIDVVKISPGEFSIESFQKSTLTSTNSRLGISTLGGGTKITLRTVVVASVTKLFVAVSEDAGLDQNYVRIPSGEGFYSTENATSAVFGRVSWQIFHTSPSFPAQSEAFTIHGSTLTGHAFAMGDIGPVLPLEHLALLGGRQSSLWGRATAAAVQRYAHLVAVDTEALASTGNIGAFPILVSRFNDGVAVTNERSVALIGGTPDHHLSRGYEEVNLGVYAHISVIVREQRFISRTYSYDVISSGRLMHFNLDPGPVRILEVNNVAAINGGYLSSFDGQTHGEMTPIAAPEWIAINVFATANALGFLSFTPIGDDGDTLRFAVELELVDRAGNIRRTGPAYNIGGPQETLFIFALGMSEFSAPGELDFELYFSLPPVSMFRGVSGLGWRARVYFGVRETELVDVGVLPVQHVIMPEPTGNSGILVGRVSLDELVRAGVDSSWDSDGPPAGLAPFPWDQELLPERPPPFRDITLAAHRLFGISAEDPAEIFVSKSSRFGRSLEFNPVLNIYSTAVGAVGFTALAAMDDKILLFTTEDVYVVPATSADDTGRGQPPVPQLVATDTGCLNKRSVVSGPFGVMFEGFRGLYLMDRALTLKYIGGPVEDTFKDQPPVSSAVLVALHHEVRYTFVGGDTMIVYDYNNDLWSTRETAGFGAETVQGRYVVSLDTPSGYAVIAERDRADTDFTDVSAPNVMSFETAWLKLSESVAGYGRIYKIVLTGEYHDLVGTQAAGGLRVELFYDYDDSAPFETKIYTLGGLLSPGDPLQTEIRPARQRAEAIRLKITEIPPQNVAVGSVYRRGFTVSSLTLEMGVKRGTFKRPQIRS